MCYPRGIARYGAQRNQEYVFGIVCGEVKMRSTGLAMALFLNVDIK